MGIRSYRPSRRRLLQAAAAGLALGPVLGARGVVAAEPALVSQTFAGGAGLEIAAHRGGRPSGDRQWANLQVSSIEFS